MEKENSYFSENSTILDYQIKLNEKIENGSQNSKYLSIFLDEDDGYLIKLEKVFKIDKIENIARLGVCKNWFEGVVSITNSIYLLISLNKILKKETTCKQREAVLLQGSDFAINVYKIGGLINLEDLIELSQTTKQPFIDNEFLHKLSGVVLKELNVEELLNYEDLKNVFKGF